MNRTTLLGMKVHRSACIFFGTLFLCSASFSHAKDSTPLKAMYKNDAPAVLQIMFTPQDFPQHTMVVYGTGFLVGREGYFVTAAHVLDRYEAGTPRETATIHQRDLNGSGMWFDVIERDVEHDVALCQIKGFKVEPEKIVLKRAPSRPSSTMRQVTSLRIASGDTDPGESIAIIGFPLGSWVTAIIQSGNIASTNAIIDPVIHGQNHGRENFVVSVSGNHGNSGGPVISLATNQVVGLISQYVPAPLLSLQDGTEISQQSGLMLAVPAKFIRSLLERHQVSTTPITYKEDLVF